MKKRLAALLAGAEKRVVREEWASSDLTSFEPYYFERNQYSRGRKLKAQPAKTKDAQLYGYDAAGAVVRIRSWSGFLGKWHEEEIFMPKKDGVIIGYRYRVDGTLLNEHRWTFDEENRLVLHEIEFSEAKKKGSQRFLYVDGLLERVVVKNWGQSWAITHDALGRLETISEVWSGTRHEIYRRPAKGEKLSDLLALIRERLLTLIPRVVAKAKPKSVAYALAIAVDTEEWRYPLPPSLALAFEDDRKRFTKNHPDNVRQFLWSVAELPCFDVEELDLRDERLTEACTRANQHLWKGGDQGQVTPFLRKIAKELQGVDFRALRSVSDDFFVYVTSLESDGWPDARRDAPPAIKKRLIARGEL